MRVVKATFFICLLAAAMLFPGAPAFPETDVTSSFRVDRERPYYDYTRHQTCTTLSLTNISEQTYQETIRLVIDSITSSQVTAHNPDGLTGDGKPSFDLALPWHDFEM